MSYPRLASLRTIRRHINGNLLPRNVLRGTPYRQRVFTLLHVRVESLLGGLLGVVGWNGMMRG
ncbi:hypothetical protein BU23DRAFT_162009 [Bimuria novae-zelandiae CBS 107.79]|uniref:Uncharacterized protein n=1 Tax=Bimuria novae-zelandiae CBS 107.79 TaxID=1447943 RepID=A0A6A5V648_9PLEO|nr:hypothetical protein BU23DRAFT_162009 [Bimuria novae-zelandiae CBS 107.79]